MAACSGGAPLVARRQTVIDSSALVGQQRILGVEHLLQVVQTCPAGLQVEVMLNDDGGERLLGLGVFGLARIFLTERGGNRGAALAPPVEVVACLNLYRRLVEIVAADRSGEQTGTGIATPVAIGVEGRVDAFGP